MKKGIKVVLAAASALLISAPAFAYFHSGGAGQCEGCHTMHNSLEGSAISANLSQYQTGPYLLKANDQSGSCLNCHNTPGSTPSGYHISSIGYGNNINTAPSQYTPGGDFAWVQKSFTFNLRGNDTTEDGDRHGHNIVAADYGYIADKTLTEAPGGTYPAAGFACSSCHDPHGKYRRLADGSQVTSGLPIADSGSYQDSMSPLAGKYAVGVYRILGGVGYKPKSLTGGYDFVNKAPDAVAPTNYNRLETTSQTRVAYGQGMSEWCVNCHTKMYQNGFTSGMGGLVHPAGNNAHMNGGTTGNEIYNNYNKYVSSGVMTNTDPIKAYSTLVPFEIGTADYSVLKPLAVTDDSSNMAATTTSNVSCLSCHRVHASGFSSMLRYSMSSEFMTIADAAGTPTYDPNVNSEISYGKSVIEQTGAYYGRPATAFGPYARNLCNKCHAKD